MEDFEEFSSLELIEETGTSRDYCERCWRPSKVCWCKFCPHPRISLETEVFILQHPHERKRSLRTAPMLEQGLKEGTVHILIGRHFNPHRYPVLEGIPEDPNTILLYPSKDSIPLSSLYNPPPSTSPVKSSEHHATSQRQKYKLILLDGTWMQARSLYQGTRWLANLKKVHVSSSRTSDYVIHTQPLDACLSTVEAAALALAELEQRPDIVELITKPLREMVAIQLRNGAVPHHSKETMVRQATEESTDGVDRGVASVFQPSDDLLVNFSKHLKKNCPM